MVRSIFTILVTFSKYLRPIFQTYFMFKRAFGRFIVIASLAFAMFFLTTVILAESQPVENERAESSAANKSDAEEGFRLETLVGSILSGIQ
jgi:hypothetical protein